MSASSIVTFNYATWTGQYPEFNGTVTPGQAQGDFNMATWYVDNTGASPVVDAAPGGRRETILYMLTAHIAQLLQGSATQAASSLVGQVTGATEGSVTVALAEMQNPGAAWFTQTKYGMMAWQALAQYRTALYSATPQIPLASQSLAGRLGYLGGFPFAS